VHRNEGKGRGRGGLKGIWAKDAQKPEPILNLTLYPPHVTWKDASFEKGTSDSLHNPPRGAWRPHRRFPSLPAAARITLVDSVISDNFAAHNSNHFKAADSAATN
jgi:hypothetical protein